MKKEQILRSVPFFSYEFRFAKRYNQAKRVGKLACQRASADCSASASLLRSKARSATAFSGAARKEYDFATRKL
jgi:hypothetical protein